MTQGPQRQDVDLSFSIPSECARQVEDGRIQIGLVPVAEIARQGLEIVPGVGIACYGAVRSILLFSRARWRQVRTLAADLSSRTSVQLARVILRERYGVEPEVTEHPPVLGEMIAKSDAALIIGDPALRIIPEQSGLEWLDLGAEWLTLTGLPMVFAAWAGKPGLPLERLRAITVGSYEFGQTRIGEIVEREHDRRGVPAALANRYLREHIRFELGQREQQGLTTFWEMAKLNDYATTGD
jgi:predicted solute-binding protein